MSSVFRDEISNFGDLWQFWHFWQCLDLRASALICGKLASATIILA
jgi:hypothetical protein